MVVTSTIDKIKDTTIMKQVRKLAGVIDEQNADIEAVNEKLDNFDISGVEADISKLKTEVASTDKTLAQVKISGEENTEHLATVDSTLDNHARNIKTNTDAIAVLKSDTAEIDTNVQALNKELPTEFTLYRTGSGKIQLQCEKEDSTTLDSNVLDMVIPESYNIVSGTTNRSFKLEVAFSDGTKSQTNDFVIPEGGGTDVTVTGITLTKVTANTFKASIVLSDSTTIDSGTLTTVNSVAGSFTNNKLTITVNGVSSTPITIDTGTAYTAGDGIAIQNGKISVSVPQDYGLKFYDGELGVDFTVVSDVDSVDTVSANVGVLNTKVTGLQSAVGDCFNAFSISGNTLTMTATDGQSNSQTLPGGFSWNTVTLATLHNFDYKPGDLFMIRHLQVNSKLETAAYGLYTVESYSDDTLKLLGTNSSISTSYNSSTEKLSITQTIYTNPTITGTMVSRGYTTIVVQDKGGVGVVNTYYDNNLTIQIFSAYTTASPKS